MGFLDITFTEKDELELNKCVEEFDKLCETITPEQAGFSSKEELISVLEEFYTPSAQKKFGVVGIEIKKN
jgi:ASC-1-like (ASCH) protein